jgi:hypothetical protein
MRVTVVAFAALALAGCGQIAARRRRRAPSGEHVPRARARRLAAAGLGSRRRAGGVMTGASGYQRLP